MAIRLLVLDVDGVLTDGTFVLSGEGEQGELKAFHARDGLGLRFLMDAGIQVAFLTGRSSVVVARRARELGIAHVIQGRSDKVKAMDELREELGLERDEIAFMGDDLVDVPAMRAAGLGAAPADAQPDTRAAATWVAQSNGGRGAVRELCEHILAEQGLWETVRARFCD